MSTVSGLRILQKNIALSAALRFNGARNKRLPRRIIYYARYATQLNFLRWSDRLIHPQMATEAICNPEKVGDHPDEIDLVNPPSMVRASTRTSSEPPKDDDDDDDFETVDTISETDVAPLFKDHQEYAENSYIYRHIHKRLDKFKDIENLVYELPINPSLTSLADLVGRKNIMQTTEYAAALEQIMTGIQNYIRSMNQQELAILLTAIKNNNTIEYRGVKKMIDIELRWLLKKHVRTRLMDLDLWFYLADIFYECLMNSSFVHVLVNYLTDDKELAMSNSQFLHLLFLVILKRNQEGILLKYEQRIQKILNKASFGDIATISLAYFKTQTPITNSVILGQIIDKTTEHLPYIDFTQPGYCSIIKSVRYSRCLPCRESVLHLVMTIAQDSDCEMIFSNPFNAVHTIKMMETYRIYDRKLLDLITSTMFKNLDKYRIKDIQYALTSLSNFGYKIDQIDVGLKKNLDRLCEDIVTEIRNDCEKQAYHIMPMLRAFAIFRYHNDKFIDYVNRLLKDPSKLKQMMRVLEFERSAMLTYVATRLEGGKVKLMEGDKKVLNTISASIDRETGNTGSVRQDSSIRYLDFLLKRRNQTYLVINNIVRDLATSLAASPELQDESYKFNFQHTLPHQNYADLVISKDCKQPGPYNPETIMPVMVPEGERHCLIYGVRKFDYIDGHRRLCGYKKLMTRLLTKLGYTVVYADLDNLDAGCLARQIKATLDGGCSSGSNG